MGRVRVAVIGAGATGLVNLKFLLQVFRRPDVEDELEIICFEKSDGVGGVW